MPKPEWNEAEATCLKRLADLFEMGDCDNGAGYEGDPRKSLNLPPDQWESVLAKMEEHGAIDAVVHEVGNRFFTFRITARAVRLARMVHEEENEEREPEDIVEKIQSTARQNRIVAYIIIGFFALTAAATLVNQTIQIFQNIGWLAKP